MAKTNTLLMIVVIAGLLHPPAIAAEGPGLDAIERTVRQIVSPIASEQAAGKAWCETNSDAIFAELTRLVERGDVKEQERAALAAVILISPWVQGISYLRFSKTRLDLYQLRRPTDRPLDHPHAPALRKAALDALTKLLTDRATPAKGDYDGEIARFPGHSDDTRVRSLWVLLAEITDAAAADRIAALLAAEKEKYLSRHLFYLLNDYHGTLFSYANGGPCGNSSPEELKHINEHLEKERQAAKAALLDWHHRHRARPVSERTELILDLWDARFKHRELTGFAVNGGDWTAFTFPLIRLGKPAVETIRKRALGAPAENYWHRGSYEIILAGITGEPNKEFTARMLKGDAGQTYLACEIIRAAGSKDYKDELAAMVRVPNKNMKASTVLAAVHRMDAITILESARADDYMAKLAAKELRLWGE